MRTDWPARTASAGRWILLAVLACQLLFRQKFAHLTLFGLARALGLGEHAALQRAYLTEVVLVLLLPLAAAVLITNGEKIFSPSLSRLFRERKEASFVWKLPIFLALAFALWGAGHVAAAFFAGRDPYLIFRQSAMDGYVVFFLYTVIFFGAEARSAKTAVFAAVLVAVFCAILDAAGLLADPADTSGGLLAFLAAKPFGQETLPVAILGLGLCIVSAPAKLWFLRGLAFAALLLACWRQSARFQSVVPVSLAGALACYLLLGAGLALRGQRSTLKRAASLAAFFAVLLAFAWLALQAVGGPQKAAPLGTAKVKSWSWKAYEELFCVYDRAAAPADPKDFVLSRRTGEPVRDPEVYKLNAVFDATGTDLSTRENIWRLLIWRRMLADWQAGQTVIGAGVGRPWFYEAMYHTQFHPGEDRLGLDPHNSYLNLLYRFGAVGFLIFGALLLAMFACLWRTLKPEGDTLLEGIILYFFYTLFFAFFVVSLEGPSYSMPFWMAMGLAYVAARRKALSPTS